MVAFDTTTLTVFLAAFFAVAAVAAVLAVATISQFVVSNRRIRLARHESIRTYYRGFVLAS